jgi:hypothetical protein
MGGGPGGGGMGGQSGASHQSESKDSTSSEMKRPIKGWIQAKLEMEAAVNQK